MFGVPIIQAPALSNVMLQTIAKAEAMHGFIQTNMPDKFKAETTEIMLFAGLLSLVEEHHGAILYLLRTGQHDGSALALVRPLIDACYRAHWIYACAKPATLELIRAGKASYPPLPNMAEEIDKKVDAGGFFLTILPAIKTLHGYTHGGLEQVARRFSPDGDMKPHYTDGEKQEVINATIAHFTALAVAWSQLVTSEITAGEIISAKYNEIYGSKEII